MSKSIYLECNSGISGDMTVAALLDLGADEKGLREALSTIDAGGFEVKISRVDKAGISCMDFDVILDAEHENHDHDMAYLYGHEHHHDHEHHDHEHHDHEHHDHEHHDHEHHDHEHHHHEHRNLSDVNRIIDSCKLTDHARELAKRIFAIVAEAESKAHNKPVEEVHFHEVGAIDSIVDVIAAAYCLDNLGISDVIVPKLCEGYGTVRCQHGILPIPVPAVANIVADHGIAIESLPVRGELVTPTGAAIVAAARTTEQLPKTYKISRIGLGAGKREYETPGFVRAMILEV